MAPTVSAKNGVYGLLGRDRARCLQKKIDYILYKLERQSLLLAKKRHDNILSQIERQSPLQRERERERGTFTGSSSHLPISSTLENTVAVYQSIKVWSQLLQGPWRNGEFSEGHFLIKSCFSYINKKRKRDKNWQGIGIFWL